MEQILGEWQRTIYKKDDFSIAAFFSKQFGLITCKGSNLPEKSGSEYSLSGKWIASEKYGKQFEVQGCEWVKPYNQEGIIKYLGSGVLPGIGLLTAAKIYQMFGESTMEVLENDPRQLVKVKGISAKKLPGIIAAYAQTKDMREICLFFAKYQVPTRICAKLYQALGAQAMAAVRTDPFSLCEYGVTFASANRISLAEDHGAQSFSRVKHAVEHVMNKLTAPDGHLYTQSGPLITKTLELLNQGAAQGQRITEKYLRQCANEMTRVSILSAEKQKGETRIYLTKRWEEENETARLTARRIQKSGAGFDAEQCLETAEERGGIELSENQREAVLTAFKETVTVITGGAGTGKTTTLKAICDICDLREGLSYALISPTGRAARRMAEVTGRPASTIHSFFGLGRDSDSFAQPECSDVDLLIADEISMCDARLFHIMLTCTKPSAKLVLIGDHHQLPSVGAGNVLYDLITSGVVPVVYLNEIYRQGKDSKIIGNSILVNSGSSNFEYDDSFQLLNADTAEEAQTAIVNAYLEEARRLGTVDQVQALSPYREKGAASALAVNQAIQARINPGKPGIRANGVLISVGDRVIQQKNKEEIKNGDIGYVKSMAVIEGDPKVEIVFDSGNVWYSKNDLTENRTSLAYCVTVHKSQGSEFSTVILPVISEHVYMLRRNLFYTAITRAKEKVVLVGKKRVIAQAVSNDRVELRNTGLAEKLRTETLALAPKPPQKKREEALENAGQLSLFPGAA